MKTDALAGITGFHAETSVFFCIFPEKELHAWIHMHEKKLTFVLSALCVLILLRQLLPPVLRPLLLSAHPVHT